MSLDRFIAKNGDPITRKRPTTKVFNDYGELDFTATTWSDTSSTMILDPEAKKLLSTENYGLAEEGGMISGQVKSSLDIIIGDFVIYNSLWFRVMNVSVDTFKGFTIKHVELRYKEVQA